MSISFQCPNCGKAYKVKDELAGKKATCTSCKKPMLVPGATIAGGSSLDHQVLETMAMSTLADEPAVAAPVAEVEGKPITLECSYCFETVEFAANMAGKQAPCPSCRRIVKIPAREVAKKVDWRDSGAKMPFGARRDAEPAPEGAWGSTQVSVVSRDALIEADAVPVRRRQLTLGQRINRAVVVVGLLCIAAAGYLYFRSSRDEGARQQLLAAALKPGKDAAPLPPPLQAAMQLSLGQYYLRQSTPDYPSAHKHLKLARAALANANDVSLDRLVLIGEVALLQTELGGSDAEAKDRESLTWPDCQKEIRQTLDLIPKVESRENREAATWILARLARSLGLKGPKEPMVLSLASALFPADERADARGIIATQWLQMGPAEIEAAQKLAEEDKELGSSPGTPAEYQAALCVATMQLALAKKIYPEPTSGEPTINSRIAYIAGHAAGGDLEAARKIAALPGPFEQKLVGWVTLAESTKQPEPADVDQAVRLAAEQLQRYTVSSVLLARLARVCRLAGKGATIETFAPAISNPSAKSWVQLEALRGKIAASPGRIDPAAANGVGETGPALALAWVEIGRADARSSGIQNELATAIKPPLTPFGSIGIAQGLSGAKR